MLKETSKKYDKIAKEYSTKIYNNFWNNLLEYPTTAAEIKKLNLKGKKILDAGCGTGRYTKILVSKDAKVWGIDASKKMINIAKQNVKNARFMIGDICRTKFKSGFFDFVVSALVLEYLDRNKFFKEMSRILKKNGLLLFSVHIPYVETAGRVRGKHPFFKRNYVFKFKNYFEEEKFYQRWRNFRVRMPFKHVTMQTTIRAIVKNGFTIEDYIDFKPPTWSRKRFREDYERVIRLPPFCLMKLRKL